MPPAPRRAVFHSGGTRPGGKSHAIPRPTGQGNARAAARETENYTNRH